MFNTKKKLDFLEKVVLKTLILNQFIKEILEKKLKQKCI